MEALYALISPPLVSFKCGSWSEVNAAEAQDVNCSMMMLGLLTCIPTGPQVVPFGDYLTGF